MPSQSNMYFRPPYLFVQMCAGQKDALRLSIAPAILYSTRRSVMLLKVVFCFSSFMPSLAHRLYHFSLLYRQFFHPSHGDSEGPSAASTPAWDGVERLVGLLLKGRVKAMHSAKPMEFAKEEQLVKTLPTWDST